MFEQMTIVVPKRVRSERLDNEIDSQRPYCQPSGSFWKMPCCKGPCNMRGGNGPIFPFMQRASKLQERKDFAGECVAKGPGLWVLKRGNG